MEELEGKEVEYYILGEDNIICIVAGCEYDIGITLVRKSDKNSYILCYQGPSSPKRKDHNKENLVMYKEIFNKTVEQIKNGIVYPHITEEIIAKFMPGRTVSEGPTVEKCAFT